MVRIGVWIVPDIFVKGRPADVPDGRPADGQHPWIARGILHVALPVADTGVGPAVAARNTHRDTLDCGVLEGCAHRLEESGRWGAERSGKSGWIVAVSDEPAAGEHRRSAVASVRMRHAADRLNPAGLITRCDVDIDGAARSERRSYIDVLGGFTDGIGAGVRGPVDKDIGDSRRHVSRAGEVGVQVGEVARYIASRIAG